MKSLPLDDHAARVRARVVAMSHRAKTAHLGSSLSCVDILVAAYFGGLDLDPARVGEEGRDRFILSKGHAAMTLYATLVERGFFPASELNQYNIDGGRLAEHPAPACAPGVEAATGSLGHGLAMGLGMALASRIRGVPFRVGVVVSDGECNEGSVWESAMLAPAKGIGNLIVVVDYNRWQATGRSDEIMALEPLADKWRAFGWRTSEVDGHDAEAVRAKFQSVREDGDIPTAVIAHTTKGKGVSFMEDDNNWHYRVPTQDEVRAAHAELGVTEMPETGELVRTHA